jgi:hypothetical protein
LIADLRLCEWAKQLNREITQTSEAKLASEVRF